jgi:hypothetical protein
LIGDKWASRRPEGRACTEPASCLALCSHFGRQLPHFVLTTFARFTALGLRAARSLHPPRPIAHDTAGSSARKHPNQRGLAELSPAEAIAGNRRERIFFPFSNLGEGSSSQPPHLEHHSPPNNKPLMPGGPCRAAWHAHHLAMSATCANSDLASRRCGCGLAPLWR